MLIRNALIRDNKVWGQLRHRMSKRSNTKDPFKYLASIIFNKSETEVTLEERTSAKRTLFQAIYGKYDSPFRSYNRR